MKYSIGFSNARARLKEAMRKQMPNREFIRKTITISLAAGTVAFALKFTTYFDNWYWLPTWPNAFDACFLIAVTVTLIALGLSKTNQCRGPCNRMI